MIGEFFATFFSHKEECLYFHLWRSRSKISTWFTDPADAAASVKADDTNVYFGMGLSRKDLGPHKRLTADTTAGIVGLGIDLDIAGPGHQKKNLPPDINAARKIIDGFPLRPTMIIHSGHGLQAFWIFKEPWIFESENEREQAQILARRFNGTFQKKYNLKYEIDSTFDLSRVYRVAGTINSKPGCPDVRAEIVEVNDYYYNIDSFEAFLLPIDQIENRPSGKADCKPVTIDPNQVVDPGLTELLSQASDKFQATWNHQRPDLPSPSEYDLALASQAINCGIDEENIGPLILAFRRKHHLEPQKALRVDYIQRTIARAKQSIANGQTLKSYPLTDTGLAERFAEQYRDQVRYCHTMGKWFIWNGRQWAPDNGGKIKSLAKNVVRKIYGEAQSENDPDQRKKIVQFAVKSESKRARNDMIDLAQSEDGVPVRAEELDANPWLLNLKNGTLNLKTDVLQLHNPGDMITKMAPVAYDPSATAPTWIKYLSDVLAPEDAAFVQRAAGYSLTGDTSEQCLFFLYGDGSNGKSVFVNTLRKILGDLAIQSDFGAFLVKRGSSVPNDIARLAGARMVIANELAEGEQLNEVFVKTVTGNDTIAARFLHQEFFEFEPLCKILLVGNHLPRITGTDHAIWRRIKLVNFPNRIADHMQDKRLEQKLSRELPGILNWALEGLRQWRKSGLQPPQSVQVNTDQYRAISDSVQLFINEQCALSQGAWVVKADLYAAYSKWCQDSEIECLSDNLFSRRVKNCGVSDSHSRVNGTPKRIWTGIELSDEDGKNALTKTKCVNKCVTAEVIELKSKMTQFD
ncbi:DNA primase family protein [Desulfatitalea tepidiphila]|uniref:DNA primase family protein n=1 Tax=Desulfatitalea tepidiphila TaxID=1185843 RepID=UPI0006B64E70|nr:phage/plasmid primase, P4 family [Desulfatitalea tepidiphila]